MADPPPKGFDRLLLAAFEAGLRHGSGLNAPHPCGNCGRAYAAWRQQWAGQPHEDQGGRWVHAPGCQAVHRYGEENWRPALVGHDHWITP